MRQLLKILLLLLAGLFRRLRGPSASDDQATSDRATADSKQTFWQTARVLIFAAAGLGIIGFVVLISGIVPIKASSGHWGVTQWILNFAKQRSVATHSLSIEAPPLSDRMLVVKGAGAYENNCKVCHGSPTQPHPAVAQYMLPRPPYLPLIVHKWDSEELFYIVKHGLKFTGMPAWPAPQRDDEVWAVVAFLREFPKLDQNGYRSLVGPQGPAAPRETFDQVVSHCENCHGPQGLGRGLGAAPRLAGQKVDYLYSSLWAYSQQRRFSGIMQPITSRLSADEMQKLARHYASLPRSYEIQTSVTFSEAINRGESIANQGLPQQRVPPCNDCHGEAEPKNPLYPELSGQYANYIVLQLRLFQQGHRGGTPYAHLMRHVAPHLSEEQMRDVALYYESLDPQIAPAP
jgi:cytochrome c553